MPASQQSQAIVDQGRVLLGSLSILLYVSSVSAVDVGMRSGEIEALVVTPVVRSIEAYQEGQAARQAAEKQLRAQEAEAARAERERKQEEVRVQSETRVIINNNSSGTGGTRVQQYQYKETPSVTRQESVYQGSSATPFPAIDTEAMRRESAERMEAFQRESDARMQAAKEEGQRGLEEFRAQSELELEAFRAEHGFE